MDDLTADLRDAIAAAVDEILASSPGTPVSGVCVFSDADAMTLGVVMNSVDNLAARTTAHAPEADPTAVRWQPDFWDLGPEDSTRLNDLITAHRPHLSDEQVRAGDWGPIERFAGAFFGAVVDALAALRSGGFFDERSPGAVVVLKLGDVVGEHPLEAEAIARLNTPADAREFSAWAATHL